MLCVIKRKTHRYLIDGGSVPRTTKYRQRKARNSASQAQFSKTRTDMEKHSSESCDDESPNATLACDFEESPSCGDLRNLMCSDLNNDDASSSQSSPKSFNCAWPTNESTYNYNIIYSEDLSDEEGPEDKANSVEEEVSAEEELSEDEVNSGEEEESTIHAEEGIYNDFDGDTDMLQDVTPVCSSNHTNKENLFLNNPLCICSPTTQGDALLYCLALGIRHNLTWVAMVDILKMINLLYGYEAVSATKYHLQKVFHRQKTAKYHLYCSTCETYLGVKGDNSVESSCECSNSIHPDEQCESFFVSVDLAEQFKCLVENEVVAKDILTYRFQRKKCNEEAYEDIYDGEVYKKFAEDSDLLGNPYNFSYTFNTDGVQMGKSTKNAAWPIFISINELSPQNRKRYTMFAGVWVGKTQPKMRIFLKPFVDEANKLSSEGFFWTDSYNNQCHSRVFPLCCVVDSAARYKLLNLSSYTAYYGCTFCYQQAENTTKGRRFTIIDKEAPLRSHQSMIKDMNKAFEERNNRNKKKRIIKGCRGYTPLVLMNHLSLDTSFVVDSMHNSFLGVSKSHVSNLLSSFGKEFYIGSPEKKASLDSVLCNICPPTTITRPPRSIEEWKMWKASEWRSWLLLYVLVCLHCLIPKKYLHHLALLATAIHLLLQKSVSHNDIQLANQYLRKYVFLTQNYFGKTAMLYNCHLLLHICKGVLNFGPLQTHNSFQFEGENHYFMQMRTSPGHVTKQLVTRYSVFAEYPRLCELYASSEEPLKFLNDISGKSLKSFIKQDGCVLIGKGKPSPFDSIKNIIQPLLPEVDNANVVAFDKMIFMGVRYCTSSYAEGKKHNDSYISLGPNLKARIDSILQIIPDLGAATVVLLVTPYTVRLPDFLRTNLVYVPHIKEIVKSTDVLAVKPSLISGQCVYMDSDGREFLADIAFGCYGD